MKCPNCGNDSFSRTNEPLTLRPIEGVVFDAEIPAHRCASCGEVLLDASYLHAFAMTSAAQLLAWGFVTPRALMHARKAIGMSRQSAAQLAAASVDDIERWESGDEACAPATYVRSLRSAVDDTRMNRIPLAANIVGATAAISTPPPVMPLVRELHVPLSVHAN